MAFRKDSGYYEPWIWKVVEDEGTSPRNGVEERKEGMPFKKLLYMVSGALWTWDNWYSNHAATASQCDCGTRKFLTRGCLLEIGAGYQRVTAQLKWLLYCYICERPRSFRPTNIQSNKNPSAWYFVRPAQAVTCGTVAIIIGVVLFSPYLGIRGVSLSSIH